MGIDVSKGRLDASVRPAGEHFGFPNDNTGCFNGLSPAPSEPLSEDWGVEAAEERREADE